MGLDMYLQKAKRIGDVTSKQLTNVDSYLSYLERPTDYKDCTMKKWCGVDINEVDMQLVEDYRSEFTHKYGSWDSEKKYGWKTIIETVADWRKANHIHNWFVDNVQDGVDDCESYEVTKEQLEELLDICKEVVDGSKLIKGKLVDRKVLKDGKLIDIQKNELYIEDTSIAEELLPTRSGFFFGGTEYDEWYIADVKYTIEVIENVLSTTDFEHEIVMYGSSW